MSDQEAVEAAAEEEKEALLLQKQMADRLDSDDFYKCDIEVFMFLIFFFLPFFFLFTFFFCLTL